MAQDLDAGSNGLQSYIISSNLTSTFSLETASVTEEVPGAGTGQSAGS